MPRRLILLLFVSSLALLAILVGAVNMVGVFIEGITTSVPLNSRSVRIALSGAFVVGAVVLYALKKSRGQFAYGLAEITVGLVANWRSLDTWSHPVTSPGRLNILFARLAILGAGIYLISRGISNVLDGFAKLFPIPWSNATLEHFKQVFKEGYNAPPNIPIPKSLLKYQIAGTK